MGKQLDNNNKKADLLVQTGIVYSLQEFKSTEPISTNYFSFPIHYKKVEDDYIIYRGQNWQQHQKFKTIIFMPATAYLAFNRVYVDCALPGILSHLPSDFQIIVAIFPNAPEQKFPAPILHLQKTISYLIDHHTRYLIDPSSIVLSGYSCGATMTVPLGLYFAQQSFLFKSLLCVAPVFDYTGQLYADQQLSKKWKKYQSQDFPFYAPAFLDFINNYYSQSATDLAHPWYSPYFTPDSELKKLPKPCFLYGQKDFMRRSIEAFKQKLTKASIDHQSILLNGEGHNVLFMTKIGGNICEPYGEELIPTMKTQVFKQVTKYLKKVLI